MRILKSSLTLSLCIIARLTFSQDANLVLKGIEETRHIDFRQNELSLTTELKGIMIDESHQIRLKKVTAEDDLKNDLQPLRGYPYPTGYFINHKEIVIGLEAPGRQARKITVKGIIEYFTITEELQSKLSVADLQQHYHKNLLAGLPADVKLVLIDIEGLSKLKEDDEAKYHEKVKEIHENAGVGAGVSDAKRYLDHILANYTYWEKDLSTILHFYKEDSGDNIVEIGVYDKEGEEITQGSFSDGDTYSPSLEKALTPENELRVQVKNEDATKEIGFQLNDIELP